MPEPFQPVMAAPPAPAVPSQAGGGSAHPHAMDQHVDQQGTDLAEAPAALASAVPAYEPVAAVPAYEPETPVPAYEPEAAAPVPEAEAAAPASAPEQPEPEAAPDLASPYEPEAAASYEDEAADEPVINDHADDAAANEAVKSEYPAVQQGQGVQVEEPEEPPLSVLPFLRALVELSGSDLHCKTGAAPRIRIDGRLRRVRARDLTAADTENMVNEVMRDDLAEDFKRTSEADFGFSMPGVGRFRVNVFRARGSAGLVFRRVNVGAVPLTDLGVPEVIASLSLEPRGLVLVTGPTGSGKTTTLAGMVDHINSHKEVHIVTIEDPIEVLHQDKNSIINQREVGLDTNNFGVALRAAMRQDPDVVLVGEMRDAETVGAALSASETGHFVMSTLHTTDAAETITRVIDFFPPHEQKQIRLSLAAALKGIVCQRLVPRSDGQGRVVVMEICVNNGRIADAIADPEKTHMITDLIKEGTFYGMQTFDQHLVSLYRDRVISLDDAMHASSNPHDLQVELRAQGLI